MTFNRDTLLELLEQLPLNWPLVPVRNKKPYRDEWQKAPMDRGEIVEEIQGGRCNGIGLLLGPLSGLMAVDFDGETSIQALPPELPVEALPLSVAMTSGRPGRYQRIYRVPEQFWDAIAPKKLITRQKNEVADEDSSEQLELRWKGQQSVVIGYHPDTQGMYRWVEGCAPSEREIVEAPLALLEMMLTDAVGPGSRRGDSGELPLFQSVIIPLEQLLTRDHFQLWERGVGQGGRDNTAAAIARDLIGAANYCNLMGHRYSGTPEQLLEQFCQRCDPPLGLKDVTRILKSAERSNPRPCPGIEDRVRYQLRRQSDSDHQCDYRSSGGSIPPEGGQVMPPGDVPQRRWPDLLSALLEATEARDEAAEMELRAEAIVRFRRSDGQIDAALFKRLTERELGIKRKPIGERTGVSLRKTVGLDYLLDGFIIANDQTMISASMGTGKTTALIDATFAMLSGEPFLDHGKPASPRVSDDAQVIYIASDSDASPVKASLQAMGLDVHPWADDGPQKRIHVWAPDHDEGHGKWVADVAGCLELLKIVKSKPTALVIIDSCKAVFDAYCDNAAVTALLTFFKQVICRYTAVVWLNHDGKTAGSGAGAKAWREVPSICHHIERVGVEGSSDRRRWSCIKDRIGVERSFEYELDSDTDRLRVCDQSAVVKDCSEAVLEVLKAAWRDGKHQLKRADLLEEIRRRYGFSNKSVDNTLTRMKKGKHHLVVQPAGPRGQYALAPRLVDDLKRESPIKAGVKKEGKSLKSLQGESLSDFPSISLGKLEGKDEDPPRLENQELPDFPRDFPREIEGKSVEPSQGKRLTLFPSLPTPHVIGDFCPSEGEAGGDRTADDLQLLDDPAENSLLLKVFRQTRDLTDAEVQQHLGQVGLNLPGPQLIDLRGQWADVEDVA